MRFGENLKNLRKSIDETLEYKKDISIFDIINGKSDEFIICLKEQNILRAFDEDDDSNVKADLYVDKYLIGTKFIEEIGTFELSIKQDDTKFQKCLLKVNIFPEDIPFFASLYSIFINNCDKKIVTKELSRKDKLTKIYIETILGIYGNLA